jgi:hypothetical protein
VIPVNNVITLRIGTLQTFVVPVRMLSKAARGGRDRAMYFLHDMYM